MAKQKTTKVGATPADADLWAGFAEATSKGGFEEVERKSAKRLDPGEMVDGQYRSTEKRTGVNPNNGEVSDYHVHTLEMEDGSIRPVGGAPILDSLISAANLKGGEYIRILRAPKNGEGKRGRSGPGQYKLFVKKS
jgi:hypothetical protein